MILSSIARFFNRFKSSLVTGLVILFTVRMLAVFFNTPANIGDLVRPYISYPAYIGQLSVVLFLGFFILHHFTLKKLPVEFTLKIAKIFPVGFILLALFTTTVNHRSYLFSFYEGRLNFQDFIALQTMDFFFQEPYTFWCICWFFLTYYITRRVHKERYLDILWLIPYFFLTLNMNNLMIVFYISMLTAAAMGFKYRLQPPRFLFFYWGLTFVTTIFFLSHYSIIHRTTLLVASSIFPVIWLIPYWYLRVCERENTAESKSLSWFSVVIFAGIISQVLFPDPMSKCLLNFWFILFSMNWAFLTIIPILLSSTIAYLAGLSSKKLERPVFFVLIATFSLFYITDAMVFNMNGLRLNYHTLNWIFSLKDLSSIIDTAIAVINSKIAILMFATLFIPAFVTAIVKKSAARKPAGYIANSLSLLFIISATSHLGYAIATSRLNVLNDPFRSFLATIPHLDDLLSSRPEFSVLKNDFKRAGFDLDKAMSDFKKSQKGMVERKKNLVVITLESTGNEYVSMFGQKDMTWPNLEARKDQIEVFPKYFSTFPESANAEFSLMTSLMPAPLHILRSKPEFQSEILIEILKAAGYKCHIFFSGFLGDTGLASFYLPRGADEIFDATTLPKTTTEDGWTWGIKEHIMVDRVNALIREKGKNPEQPFFIYYRTIFPHTPLKRFENTPPHFPEEDLLEGKWVGRFKNCLIYIDGQIERIIKALEETGLSKDTYVVIVSDHATMLGEFVLLGHGWNLAPYLTNVPFLIVHPEKTGFKTNLNAGSHIDFLPTALNLIGVKNRFDNIIQGRDLRGPAIASRSIFLSSFTHQALLEGNLYYWWIADRDEIQLYKFGMLGRKNRFRKIINHESYAVDEKINKIKKIMELQKTLLMNYEYYNKAHQTNIQKENLQQN
jgi:phosphoglycerol transferase MdoB-like AlkP superfamily enzyme